MALVRGFKVVPKFQLRGPPFCGEDCERFLVEAVGKEWRVPPRGLLWQLVHPETSSLMEGQLRKIGIVTKQLTVSADKRIGALQDILRRGRCVALWVRTSPSIPIAAHIVVAAGYDGAGTYYIMDDRKGSAHDSDLPVGNARWAESKLFSMWQDYAWSDDATMLWLS